MKFAMIWPALLLGVVLSLSACASQQSVEAGNSFRELLTGVYGIADDRIATTPVEEGVPRAVLLIEADTCRIELILRDDDRVEILKVGEWVPPGALWLLKDPRDRDDHLSWLCAAYSPPEYV